jgi:regulator of sirC expression with transglutaminase-like and TPR domain
LESLLADDDIKTRKLVIDELCAEKDKNKEVVESLAHSTNPKVSAQARHILNRWSGKGSILQEASGPCSGSMMAWKQLEEFCWLIARTEYPFFNPASGTRQLDEWAGRVLDRYQESGAGPEPKDKLNALQSVLADEEGFCGDSVTYYDPDNSYMNCVIESKQGIPLTLALVYIFVGTRLKWNVGGVNTPGHYLASVDGVVFDPFFGGRVLGVEELSKRFCVSPEECRSPDFFQANPFETAHRMLSNLINSYTRYGDDTKLRRVSAYMKILQDNMS